MDEQTIEEIVKQVIAKYQFNTNPLPEGHIPIGVSARHIHLQQDHVEILFGSGYQLTKKAELSQPGQFAANETLLIAGRKGSIEKVRILGPIRPKSQVEVSLTDTFKLGVAPPVRESGDLEGSEEITLIGPKGSVHLKEGLIIAKTHIHMNNEEAKRFNVTNGQSVSVAVNTLRPIIFNDVIVRVSDRYSLEMHIDTDEANAGFITQGTIGKIVNSPVDDSSVQIKPNNSNKNEQKNIHLYKKKLLTKEDIENISETEIHLQNSTIITALASDRARELNKRIKIV